MIYLVIATAGEYSGRTSWVVQASTNEAEAVEEAARLNAEIMAATLLHKDYWTRHANRLHELEFAAGVGPMPFLDRGLWSGIHQKADAELGAPPETPADDHTVVAIPIGERGRWDLP